MDEQGCLWVAQHSATEKEQVGIYVFLPKTEALRKSTHLLS